MRGLGPAAAGLALALGLACAGAPPPPPEPPPPVDPTGLARLVGGVAHVRLGPIGPQPGEPTAVDGLWRWPVDERRWTLAAGSRWTVLDGRGAPRECPVTGVVALARGRSCPAQAYAVLGCTAQPAGPAVALAAGRPLPAAYTLADVEPQQRAEAELALAHASAWREVVEASRAGGATAMRRLDVERFRGPGGDLVLVEGAMTSFGGTRAAWTLFFAEGDQLGDQLGPWVKTGRPTGVFDLDADGLPEVLVQDGPDLGLRGLDGRDRLGDVLPACP